MSSSSYPPIDMDMVRLCLTIQDFDPFGPPLPSPLQKQITRGGGSVGKPYFFWATGDGNVYICVRGACEPSDFAICLDFERADFCGGKAHRGILEACRWIVEQCRPYIDRCTGKIICTGHSLGGASSSMIAAILALEMNRPNVYAVSLAPFPIFSSDIQERTKPFIVSFVYNNDIVPRLNSRTIGSIVQMLSLATGGVVNPQALQSFIAPMLTGIMQQSGYSTPQAYQDIATKIPSLVDRLAQMAMRPESVELMMPGRCFHIQTTPEGYVTFTPYNESIPFNIMGMMAGLTDHMITNYIDNIMCWDGPDQ